MHPDSNTLGYRTALLAPILFAITGSTLALVGWAANLPRLTDWDNSGIAMKVNTSVACLAAAFALLFLAFQNSPRWLPRLFALLTALIGGLTLFERLTSLNLGIDTLFFLEPTGLRATVAPGRMGPPASLSFLFLGTAILLATSTKPRFRRLASILALTVACIVAVSLTGYLFGANELFDIASITGIAMQTASLILALAIAVLLSVPEHNIVAQLRRKDAGGLLARRMIVPLIVIPLVTGYLRVFGQDFGLYDTALGTAMLAFVMALSLGAILFHTAGKLGKAAVALQHSRREIERQLAFNRGVLESISDGFHSVNSDFIFTHFNDAAQKILGAHGLDTPSLLNKSILDLYPKDDSHPLTAAFLKTMNHRVPSDIEVFWQPWNSWFSIRNYPTDDGGVATFFIEITQRKISEEALRQSERRFRAAVGAVSSLIWTNNAQGLMEGEQPGWASFTGQSYEDCRGLGWLHAIHPDDVHATVERWKRAFEEKRAIVFEHRVRRRDGVWRLCTVRAVPVLSADGEIYEWVGVHTDITDQRQAEQALREADRRKDDFLATLAHELRNPLAPIRHCLEIIKSSAATSDTLAEARATMERQVSHMVRLIEDLLDVSRITQDRLLLRTEKIELSAILKLAVETCSAALNAASHCLTLELPADPIYLRADPVRLVQVFGNLLNNACKYMDEGGQITLSARLENARALVAVGDTGIGIPPDMLSKIFNMFTQVNRHIDRSHGGLGIGLSLAKRLVELHGGTLTASSPGLGKGAQFLVDLPVESAAPTTTTLTPAPPELAPAKPATREPALTPPTATARRILVVDDNKDAARSLAKLLTLEGHHTQVAHDGLQGIAAAKSYNPDIILLDIGMSEMNGYDACRTIRSRPGGERITIIALTGWGQDEDRRKSKEAGFDQHLVKPINLQTLRQLLTHQATPS